MPHFRIRPNFLNQPIKCFFDLLGSYFSNRPNWNMQWILWWLLLILITPPFFKRIRPQIVTYIKKRKIKNIKCSTNIILAKKSNLYSLSLILERTWNGPSPLECSLDRLWVGNLSFLICTQTQSLDSKMACRRPLLGLVAYCSFFFLCIAIHFHGVSSPS